MDGPRASTRNCIRTASILARADNGLRPSRCADERAGARLLQDDEGELRQHADADNAQLLSAKGAGESLGRRSTRISLNPCRLARGSLALSHAVSSAVSEQGTPQSTPAFAAYISASRSFRLKNLDPLLSCVDGAERPPCARAPYMSLKTNLERIHECGLLVRRDAHCGYRPFSVRAR